MYSWCIYNFDCCLVYCGLLITRQIGAASPLCHISKNHEIAFPTFLLRWNRGRMDIEHSCIILCKLEFIFNDIMWCSVHQHVATAVSLVNISPSIAVVHFSNLTNELISYPHRESITHVHIPMKIRYVQACLPDSEWREDCDIISLYEVLATGAVWKTTSIPRPHTQPPNPTPNPHPHPIPPTHRPSPQQPPPNISYHHYILILIPLHLLQLVCIQIWDSQSLATSIWVNTGSDSITYFFYK